MPRAFVLNVFRLIQKALSPTFEEHHVKSSSRSWVGVIPKKKVWNVAPILVLLLHQLLIIYFSYRNKDIPGKPSLPGPGIWPGLTGLALAQTNSIVLRVARTNPTGDQSGLAIWDGCGSHSFFWYDNDSGHQGSFCITQSIRIGKKLNGNCCCLL